MAGAISTGKLSGALIGAAQGAIMMGAAPSAGGAVNSALNLTAGSDIGKMIASGMIGGLFSVAGGGHFASGFLAAGVGALPGPNFGNVIVNGVATSVLGGFASVLGGGKFANGAITAAFSYAARGAAQPAAKGKTIQLAQADAEPDVDPSSSVLEDSPNRSGLLSAEDQARQNELSDELNRGLPSGNSRSPLLNLDPNGPPRNAPGYIEDKTSGSPISGHALDQMQNRGIPPSVVLQATRYGISMPGNTPGTTQYYDSVNNVSVVTNNTTGNIITVRQGK